VRAHELPLARLNLEQLKVYQDKFLKICTFCQTLLGVQIKKDEIGGACNTDEEVINKCKD
jgi:hypothetical protein